MTLTAKKLAEACADNAYANGITIHSDLQPLGGPGSPVKPAVYAGGTYQLDRRWIGAGEDRRPVEAVVIDNVPSQANRLEAALKRVAGDIGLPEIVIDLSSHPHLPPHMPKQLSSFELPHRNADAYLRDSDLDGEPFRKSEIGSSLFTATPDRPEALIQYLPTGLLFGFWMSHLGKKGPQTKLARSWTSEIVGYEPASTETKRLGLKGDPLNLSVDDGISFDENNPSGWQFTSAAKAGKKSKDSLAEVGHGQVPVSGADAPLAPVSFANVSQRATVSFASLRRISAADPSRTSSLRALLVALGLVAHVNAFGSGFSLRSGAELVVSSSEWTWLGETTSESLERLTPDDAATLFTDCVAQAEMAGLPVGSAWPKEPVVLKPNKSLMKAIEQTFPEYEL